jgi:hypothetical protein
MFDLNHYSSARVYQDKRVQTKLVSSTLISPLIDLGRPICLKSSQTELENLQKRTKNPSTPKNNPSRQLNLALDFSSSIYVKLLYVRTNCSIALTKNGPPYIRFHGHP